MSGKEGEPGFLARWSRRKREAAAEPDAPAPEAPEAEAPPEEMAPAARASQPERPACPIPNLPAIDPASLPAIEDLTAESDFALFLRPGVPAGLRNAALRRMWSLDPAIRDYIGPVEYQWDFNAPGGLPLGFASELMGDVKKLLAQAIGEVPAEPREAEAPVPSDASATDASASDESEPQQPQAELAAAPPDPAGLPAAGSPEPDPPEPASFPAPRRRHGSALPA